jgi:hypothetical protein
MLYDGEIDMVEGTVNYPNIPFKSNIWEVASTWIDIAFVHSLEIRHPLVSPTYPHIRALT